MKALTVRQPHAWAIARGFKTIENRRGMYSFRGPLMLHAGMMLANQAGWDEVTRLAPALPTQFGMPGAPTETAFGAVIAVGRLVGAHLSDDCSGKCSPWAWDGYAHNEVEDMQVLRLPVEARGNTILWTPDRELRDAVRRQLP